MIFKIILDIKYMYLYFENFITVDIIFILNSENYYENIYLQVCVLCCRAWYVAHVVYEDVET